MSDRERAFQILERIERDNSFADPLIGRGGDRDELFVRTLVLGVLRWRGRLDYVIETLAKRPASRIQPAALGILRLGLYQLLYMDVAPYAAVSESVDLAARHAPHAKGFINAVLRNATRNNASQVVPAGETDDALAITFSHPEWLVARWRKRFGLTRLKAILEADQQLSYPDLLVHSGRIDILQLADRLRLSGVPAELSTLAADVLRIRTGTAAVAEEMEQGLVVPMDEGSVVVASLAGASSRRILDAAAAPGSKSMALTLAGHRVVSHDISLRRLMPLRASHARSNSTPPQIVNGDARQLPFRSRSFDVVLLDAPCSATGTLRKNPEARWRVSADDLSRFARLQTDLLAEALRVGDECIYSTCSLEPEENEAVVKEVICRDDSLESFDLTSRVTSGVRPWIEDGVLHLTPESGADGFTAHGIRRRNTLV